MRRSTTAIARSLLLAGAALFGAAGAALAQGTATIRGTVVDSASRQPIPGVQVNVVGTTLGGLTDASGRYLIRGAAAGAQSVRAQRIGFAPVTRAVTTTAGQESAVDFVLRQQAAVLSEVVVVGYGTRSRAEVSSAVAQVSGDAVQNVAVAGVDAALQGKAPGVQVVQNAGNPGNGISVRVRGSSSISASNQPLFVIDGVPMIREDQSQIGLGGQDLTAVTGLAPDEIESIDVLKDAAAASIYGSRASNGVVMITTKRGRPGASKFTFNTYYGQQKMARQLAMLNGPEYVAYMAEAMRNDGYDDDYIASWGVMPGVNDKVSTNWIKEVTRTAPVADYNLTASGGGDRFQYLVSGSLFDQTGIIKGTGYDRANGRVNLDVTATSKLQLRSSIGISRERFLRLENDNTIEGSGANAQAVQPNLPVYVEGTNQFTSSIEGLAYTNPVALALYDKVPATTVRGLGSLEASYDFSDRFRLNGRLGFDAYNLVERDWSSPRVPDTYAQGVSGTSTEGTSTTTKYLAETYATYDPIRSDRSKMTLTAGASAEYNRAERVYLNGEGFGSDVFQYPGNAGKITGYDAYPESNRLVSFFSRANYTLLDRYFLTASLRTDGSSRFAPDTRFGVFPSASLGWKISDEPSMSALKRLADTKLRVSYGVTGNQAIGTNTGFVTTFGRANYAGEPGLASSTQLGNPNLRWETTREYDIGADFGFLNSRVSLIADYYRKKTEDLLVSRPIASTSGFTSILDNVGNIQNKGFEFQLTTENFTSAAKDGFTWRTDFNVAHNQNEVTKLFKNEPFVSGIRSVNRVEVGQPLGAFYTIKFLGVNPDNGNACYEKLTRDDNDNITARAKDCDGNTTADDRQIVGSPHPDYFGGLRNQFTWKGFDLNSFFQFSQGNDVFNLFRLFSDDAGYNLDNKVKGVLNRWQKPGDVTDVPRPSWDGSSDAHDVSSRYVEDASYIRLQEITLGYRIPASLSRSARLSDARLYVSGQNLKLWTKYTGFDPDVNSNGSGSNTSLGQDFYAYPRARTISVGISGSW